MLGIPQRVRLAITLLVLAGTLGAGLLQGPWSMPCVRLLGWRLPFAKWGPPLIAVQVRPDPGPSDSLAPLSILGVSDIGTVPGKLLVWLGLVNAPVFRSLGVVYGDCIGVTTLNGRLLRELDGPLPEPLQACWLSADGSRIVYVGSGQEGTVSYTCQLPGGHVEMLPFTWGNPDVWCDPYRPVRCRLSADGKAAVFVSVPRANCFERPDLPELVFHWADLETKEFRLLDTLHAPFALDGDTANSESERWVNMVCTISADGSRVVYAGSRQPGEGADLYLYNVDADTRELLTDDIRYCDIWPDFLPGGEALGFLRIPEPELDVAEVHSHRSTDPFHTTAQFLIMHPTGTVREVLNLESGMFFASFTTFSPSLYVLSGGTSDNFRVAVIADKLGSAPTLDSHSKHYVGILEGSLENLVLVETFQIDHLWFGGLFDGRQLMLARDQMWVEPLGSAGPASGTMMPWGIILATTGP